MSTGREEEAGGGGGSKDEEAHAPPLLLLSSMNSQSQACALLLCIIQHLFFARGQTEEPIAALQARRGRERLMEAQQRDCNIAAAGIMRPRARKVSLVQQRKMRMADQLLLAIKGLSQSIIGALQQLNRYYPYQDDATILIRFGRSRMLCRQQVVISLRNVLLLPGHEPALQDSKVRRQKQSALERKVVRFLLNLSAEDEDFASVLHAPSGENDHDPLPADRRVSLLALCLNQSNLYLRLRSSQVLTRLHVFLLAPENFSCRGWARQRTLRLPESPASASHPGTSSLERESNERMLSDDLAAQKETQMGSIVESPSFNDFQPVPRMNIDNGDMDAKRMERLRRRAEEKRSNMQRSLKSVKEKSNKSRGKRKGPASATFAIECNGDHIRGRNRSEDLGLAEPPPMTWFACKVVLKGVR